MCNYRVLIIENQVSQFKEICKKLSEYFYVLPQINDFVKVADWTRISLTKRYDYAYQQPGKRRKKTMQKLVEYITNNKVDVIIIDHILVGHHSGENGIHLARKLKDLNVEQPIIFLSRTERNKESVKRDLEREKITEPIWIEKGYAGKGIGDDWYFNKNVVEKIKGCIGQSVSQLLDKIAKSKTFKEKNNFKTLIDNLLKKDIRISRGKRIELEEFVKTIGQKTSLNLETLLKSIENGSE